MFQDMILHGVERFVPQAFVSGQPGVNVLQRSRDERTAVHAAGNRPLQKTGAFKHPDVLADRRKGHIEAA